MSMYSLEELEKLWTEYREAVDCGYDDEFPIWLRDESPPSSEPGTDTSGNSFPENKLTLSIDAEHSQEALRDMAQKAYEIILGPATLEQRLTVRNKAQQEHTWGWDTNTPPEKVIPIGKEITSYVSSSTPHENTYDGWEVRNVVAFIAQQCGMHKIAEEFTANMFRDRQPSAQSDIRSLLYKGWDDLPPEIRQGCVDLVAKMDFGTGAMHLEPRNEGIPDPPTQNVWVYHCTEHESCGSDLHADWTCSYCGFRNFLGYWHHNPDGSPGAEYVTYCKDCSRAVRLVYNGYSCDRHSGDSPE